jgi:hypothetical protein
MTLQALAKILVTTVLARLGGPAVEALSPHDIQEAVNAVAQVLRDESASMAEPEETSCAGC